MLILRTARNRLSTKLALGAVYLLLTAGAVIAIYPLLLMLTCSTTTIEYDRFYPLPVFLWDDSALLGKYLYEKYTGAGSSTANLAAKYGVPINSVADHKRAMLDGDLLKDIYGGMNPGDSRWRESAKKRVQDWLEFKKNLPVELTDVYFCNESSGSSPKVKTGFLKFLREKYARQIRQEYGDNLRRFNAERGSKLESFEDLEKRSSIIADEISRAYHIHLRSLHDLDVPREHIASHTWLPENAARMSDWLDYKRTLPPQQIQALCLSQFHQDFLMRKYSLGLFNSLYNRQHGFFREVVFHRQRLATGGEISDWSDFLRVAQDLSTVRVVVNPTTRLLYERMLGETFGTIENYNIRFSSQKKAFFEVEPAPRLPSDPEKFALWIRFIREHAPRHLVVPISDMRFHSETLRSLHIADLRRRYLSIESLNQKTGQSFMTFEQAYDEKEASRLLIGRLIEQYGSLDDYNAETNSAWKSWAELVLPNPLRRSWQEFLAEKYGELALLNGAHGRNYASFHKIPLPAILPDHDRVEFVKTAFPLRLVALRDNSENRRLWYGHLRRIFGNSVERMSDALGGQYVTFEQVPFFYALPRSKKVRPLWIEFVEKALPYEAIHFQDPEASFRIYLREKYATLELLNAEHGTSYSAFEEIRPPYREVDLLEFYEKKGAIRMAFVFKNFVTVMRSITLHGRALLNTIVLSVLSIIGVLIVNPLAAYSLSRFRRIFSRHLHFFLLATAAFPAVLTMIPNFLLLRRVGLLNTYWAIVLPTMASGLSILILKDHFDRLPTELYDSASLDGAGELRTFLHVCLPLSKPVLGVVILQTFLFSYGRFMWPLLTCQKEKMWPLMVWLYQFDLRHAAESPELVMAALVVTAIPLVIVFLLCQRAIFREIRLPAFG